MACGEYNEYIDYLINFTPSHAFDAVYCAWISDPLSGIAFNVMFWGTIMLCYYVANRSIIVPLVLTVLLAAAIATSLPGGAVQFMLALVVFGVPTAGLWVVHRAQDRPSGA